MFRPLFTGICGQRFSVIFNAHLSLEILHFNMICVILYLRQYRTKIVRQMRSQIFV